MQTITTIGLDIAKSVFQVHGVDAGGQVIVRRQLKRGRLLHRHESATDVGVVRAPTIQRSEPCRRSQQSV